MTEAEARGADDADLAAALASAREQQAAIREVLEAMSASGFDLKEVLRTIAESAVRLCGADNASVIRRREGSAYEIVASAGNFALGLEDYERFFAGRTFQPGKDTVAGRVVLARTSVQIDDITTDPDFDRANLRVPIPQTVLGAPIMRDGEVEGILVVRRLRVAKFNAREIDVLETFSHQAAIAIENVRLFNETKATLERQTAVSEVLRIISRSPFDLDAVFQGVIASAVRLCGADNGTMMRIADGRGFSVAHAGLDSDAPSPNEYWSTEGVPLDRSSLTGRVLLERHTVAIADIFSEPGLVIRDLTKKAPGPRPSLGINHSMLGVPLLRNDEVVGVILLRRREIKPFADADIALAETFADQSVIAIENVRLLNETNEALAQQTALSEVLNTISRSAFDLDAVLQTIVERAAALCQADGAAIYRRVGDVAIAAATFGDVGTVQGGAIPIDDRTVVGRAIFTAERQYIPDARQHPDLPQDGPNTRLNIPFVRDGVAIGSLSVLRRVARPFSDSELRLFEVFADQAAIAIENVRLFNETREALDRQTAISEILRAIANSPTDQQPVLDAIAENAARFCGAADAVVLLAREHELHVAAHHGPIPTLGQTPLALERTAVAGRAVLEGRTFHVADVLGPEGDEFPQARARVAGTGQRALLAAPLLREGEAIGAILLRKDEPVPFTANQVRLVEAFADQAVIAIENVRLFNQTKEALEQQTAIAGVLEAINKSRFDQQPVLQELVDRAAGLCEAGYSSISLWEGSAYVTNAWSGEDVPKEYVQLMVDERRVPERTTLIGRTALERRTIHVTDVLEDAEYGAPAMQEAAGYRTMLGVPLLRDGFPVGIFALTRQEVRPFSERQIQLVETFAQQAVIAIENVRLFNETKEALKQRTATSEILRVISETLGDPQPVMQAIVDTVLGVCAADNAGFFRRFGDDLILSAVSGTWKGPGARGVGHQLAFHGDSIVAQAFREGRYEHVIDTSADPRYDAAAQWSRTRLAVPVLRGSETLGVIRVGRSEPGGFTEREIHLVEGFAEQAAIAFENARLFNETKESLEQQRAVAEVLKTISRSVFDLQPVLDTVVEHAARLAGGDVAWLARITGEDSYRILSRFGAAFEAAEVKTEWGDLGTMRLATSTSVMGRLLRERVVLHIQDITAEKELWDASRLIRATESRTVLAVPMLREGQPIGGVIVGRTTQRPFSDREIQLVQTFADQAAIAIENVRLFDETRESLERQTAVAQVLGAISQSGFELKSVLETVIEHATKLCAAQQGFIYRREGDVYRLAVAHGITPEFKAFTEANPVNPVGRGTITGRVAQDRMTVHVPDVLNDPEYTYWEAQSLGNFRALLGVPMIRDDQVIGVMLLWRTEPQPFTEEQIALVTTFANQATIAIENVRLFDETKEALDRQTALSEILKVISGSTFDLTPVAETVVERAARLCEADYAWIFLPERGQTRAKPTALYGDVSKEIRDELMNTYVEFAGQADLAKTFQEPDVQAVTGWRIGGKLGVRTAVFVPVGRDRGDTGRIVLGRRVVRPFTEQQIDLVEIFADQAAIAIANARLFNEIQDKGRQLEVASRHKSEFLANMSHELRTPLNAIIGFSEVLIQGLFGEVNEKQREYLHDVIGSGQHLLSLINDILDLSKIEAGRMELELSTFSFQDALASGLTIVRERASRHNITLNVIVPDTLDRVEADERKLKQIFYNLLSNAVKFTPDGGRVDVIVRQADGDVRVEVSDDGIGIAEADQARIFEEFQQVGRERSREGTGLGLTLTKRFVELHGGRIWVESAPGKGSTFTFTLPLRQAAPVRA